MSTLSDVSITIYNKAMEWQGNLSDPQVIDLTVARRGLGGGTVQVKSDDALLPAMLTKGARYVFQYKGKTLLSGRIRSPKGKFSPFANVTFTFTDDKKKLEDTLAWVVPPQVIDSNRTDITPTGWTGTATASNKGIAPTSLNDQAQSWANASNDPFAGAAANGRSYGEPYMQWPIDGTGMTSAAASAARKTEFLMKWLVHIHLTLRMGAKVTVAPNLGRGLDVVANGFDLPQPRFDTVLDVVEAIADLDGSWVSMLQEPHTKTIVFEFHQGTVYPQKLTYESGTVVDGDWSLTDPESTRVILGGTGDDDARAFVQAQDASGLEDLYGEVIEVFKDATGANLSWGSTATEATKVPKFYLNQTTAIAPKKSQYQTYLKQQARAALADGVPLSGVAIELSETESFHFGGENGFNLGDQMTAVAKSQEFVNLLESVNFDLPQGGGLTVKPTLGQKKDDPDRALADAVVKLAKALTRLRTQQ